MNQTVELVKEGPMAAAIKAMNAGLNLAEVKELQAEQRAWEAGEAHKSFLAAMVAFKANPPTILKDKTVIKPDGEDGFESYDYATIGNVCEQIIKSAAAHGLTHSWVPGRGESGVIEVTCELSHVGGHVQRTKLDAPREAPIGLTVAQAEQSVRTFLERYSLLLAFGLAAKDRPDDDGRGGATLSTPESQSVTEGWVIYANSAKTLEELSSVRKEAAMAFDEAGDTRGWGVVQQALDDHMRVLQGSV